MIGPDGPPLRDIHPPASPGWWPLAPGWWVLVALLLLALGWLAWRGYASRMRRRRWRQAARELDSLHAAHAADQDAAAFAAGVSQLLRRAARTRDPGSVRRHGSDWQAAIGNMTRRDDLAFLLPRLDEAIYRREANLDADEVVRAARPWLHRVLLHGGRRA